MGRVKPLIIKGEKTMTNIFTRMKESVSADLHMLMDTREQKNPMSALDQYLRQSEQAKEKVRKLVDRQYKLKDEFMRECHKAQNVAEKRLKKANITENAGNEQRHEIALKAH